MLTDGLVTLLFTDIEGGVQLWEADRDAMAVASARHDRMVREQIEASGGHVFKAVGEAHRAVFADPVAALSSAVAIQRAAGAEPWAASLPIGVCMALHSGACAERDGDYVGPVVNRTARLLDIAHGGQVLVTAATYALLADRLPGGIGHGRTLSQADAITLAVGTAQPDPEPAPAVTVPAVHGAPADSPAGPLSARERQIMALLAGGASNAKIAETLGPAGNCGTRRNVHGWPGASHRSPGQTPQA